MRAWRRGISKPLFDCFGYLQFCKVVQYSSNYKSTINLPKSTFPHKINSKNRFEHDRKIEIDGKFNELYNLQQNRIGVSDYILHDGPPYANGDVHIGHAVNKILKDITVRYRLLSGSKVHYVPGWDCHGLPIEVKVLKEKKTFTPMEIRKKAFTFSQKTKEQQMQSFMKWGLLADWKNSYFTCNKDYIIQQLNIFQQLFDKGIVFRDHKPVFWSPQNVTSLAEAELDYNLSHKSPSIYVKFIVTHCPDFMRQKISKNSSLNIVIWTTTPWSLPANQAVCYSPEAEYCIVHSENKKEFYIVACKMLSTFARAIKSELVILDKFESSALENVTYLHPITKDIVCPLLPSHHVTMEKGTGLVHMAPNHGFDDYTCAKKHNLPINECLVNESGHYNAAAGKELEGKDVLNSGSKHILNILKNDIILLEDYIHSYPYDWRSKTPVIIRSCHQWFIDVNQIRSRALECLQSVKIFPKHFKKVFQQQLESSPQWCISRQRMWGVPIPAFYSSDNTEPIVHKCLMENLCSLINQKGIDTWWEANLDDLLPASLKKKLSLNDECYTKGNDIMDIWFDSGISWKCVLPDPHVSDVCIEGVDQIRGWFNSSLLTSIAVSDRAPYKNIVLHGFTTDSDGRKMSKSDGNVISPDDILYGKDGAAGYGIDVLRWWIALHACQSENIAVKTNVIEEAAQNINKFRNVFKFLLGNLHEYNPDSCEIRANEMRDLDLYILHRLLQFSDKVSSDYSSFQFKNVAKDILNFVTNEVSSFYCHLVKDRLYCDDQLSIERQSSQTVLYFILNTVLQCISPVCPHLAAEVLLHHPNKAFAKENMFLCHMPSLKDFLHATTIPESILCASQIREAILKSDVKANIMTLYITCGPEISHHLQSLNRNSDNFGLTEFFQVSQVIINQTLDFHMLDSLILTGNVHGLTSDGQFTLHLIETNFEKCPRCRLNLSHEKDILCDRCLRVVNASEKKFLFVDTLK